MDVENNPKIAVLLSTYNGENYLSQQIESIIQQSYTNWVLYIRDDGSSDKTIEIINDYEQIDSRIKLMEDSVLHRGVKQSFFWLLKNSEANYYMFCDQDDVWLPDKIKKSLDAISNYSNNQAIVVCTDLILVDKNLNIINPSMWQTHHLIDLVHTSDGILTAPMFPGCTMMFNRVARNLALEEKYDFPMHDIHISLVTYKNSGKLIPVDLPLIKYRQHENNVIGLYSGNKWLLNKISSFKTIIKNSIDYYNLIHSYLSIPLRRFIILKLTHLYKNIT